MAAQEILDALNSSVPRAPYPDNLQDSSKVWKQDECAACRIQSGEASISALVLVLSDFVALGKSFSVPSLFLLCKWEKSDPPGPIML